MGCVSAKGASRQSPEASNLLKNFVNIIDNFHEGLVIINSRRDKVLNANSNAKKIYNAGLSFGSMNKMTDNDLGKKKFKRVDVKTRKGLDKDEVNIESEASIDLSVDVS